MKLLLVEDDADVACVFSALLARIGHEVCIAADANEALRRALAERPDVVVSDIALPGMSGWELARRMRSDPLLRATILIALSGFDRDQDRDRSLEAGFDDHLIKPVDARAIQDAIERALDRKARGSDPSSLA